MILLDQKTRDDNNICNTHPNSTPMYLTIQTERAQCSEMQSSPHNLKGVIYPTQPVHTGKHWNNGRRVGIRTQTMVAIANMTDAAKHAVNTLSWRRQYINITVWKGETSNPPRFGQVAQKNSPIGNHKEYPSIAGRWIQQSRWENALHNAATIYHGHAQAIKTKKVHNCDLKNCSKIALKEIDTRKGKYKVQMTGFKVCNCTV